MNETVQVPVREHEPQRNALVIFAVMAALFVSAFSQTVAGTALPRIIGELGGGTIMASAFATIGDLFSPAERGHAFDRSTAGIGVRGG
jgi:MFS family permease